MKKWFTILAMALMAVSANAQEEGEQESYKWTDLEPDESFLYRYVEAMDEASQDAYPHGRLGRMVCEKGLHAA